MVRLIDEVKSMDTDKAVKEEKLKESLKDELDMKRHYVEFSKLFETFQDALVDLNLGRIFLMSLPQEILDANPETQAVAIASDHASSLCYVILRQKRSYLRILAKKCDEYRRNNQILSDELKVAREEQKVREKTISEVMEHIQNLKGELIKSRRPVTQVVMVNNFCPQITLEPFTKTRMARNPRWSVSKLILVLRGNLWKRTETIMCLHEL